jgi:SAM-dependent methyltransferase
MSEWADLSYPGKELELFAEARNWKRYWSGLMEPSIRGDVLEVGAGLGVNTLLLRNAPRRRWVALEPDTDLHKQLRLSLLSAGVTNCETRPSTLAGLEEQELFDTILYIDVLEHIQDDASELRNAARHLRKEGRLLVLAPAHPWLFSKFDAAIGHHRRYTLKTLQAAGAAAGTLEGEHFVYLDTWGLFASLANRLLLRQTSPTQRQIRFWDRVLIPLSRLCDPILRRGIGKSVLAVWKKR